MGALTQHRQRNTLLHHKCENYSWQGSASGSSVFRYQIKTNEIEMLEGLYIEKIAMPANWAYDRWVYIYMFSDAGANKKGFGAFAKGAGAEYFEQSQVGT